MYLCVYVFHLHSLALPLYKREKVMFPPQISTEQHVPDIENSCRFPLSVTSDVLEEGRGRGVYRDADLSGISCHQ